MDINTLRELKKQLLSEKEEVTMNPRKEFEHAILVNRVASRFAMEFPTEEAKAKYLKDHPGADKSKHTVKKTEEPSKNKGEESEPESEKEEKPEFKDYKHNVDRAIQNAWYATNVSKEDLGELSSKMQKQPDLHPNKAAFDYLFPKAKSKGFSLIDLDSNHTKDDLKKWGLTKEDEGKYRVLASHLSKIRKLHLRGKKTKTASDPRREFEHAILVNRVASRFAMEFPTEEAKAKYLKDHPGADKSKHTVKEVKEEGASKAKEDFSDLPKDLTKLTKEQSKKVIDHMVKWPLSKLRKHQDLVNKQIEKAHGDKNDEALSNLRVQQKHLDSAVDKKEFNE